MAHNSPEFKRSTLMLLAQYPASPLFPTLGQWDSARMGDLFVVRGSVARTEPVRVVFIATISSDRSYLEPHGNYNAAYSDKIAKSKLQFVCTRPPPSSVFAPDYDIGINALKAIQAGVAVSDKHDHFILNGDRICLNFGLFTKRTTELDGDPVVVELTRDYAVAHVHSKAWNAMKESHHCCVMPVFDTNELPIPYTSFPDKLKPGTLIEATFTLSHYSIPRSDGTLGDTFTARIEMISILQDAPAPVTTPYRLASRRPVHASQSPSKASSSASERASAAAAFVAKGPPIAPPNFAAMSTAAVASGSGLGTRRNDSLFMDGGFGARNGNSFSENSSGSGGVLNNTGVSGGDGVGDNEDDTGKKTGVHSRSSSSDTHDSTEGTEKGKGSPRKKNRGE